MVIPTPTIRTAAPGGRLVDRWTPTHTVSYDRGDQSITHSSYDSTEETVDVEDYLSDTDASVEVMPTGKRERSHDESQSPPPSKKTRPDAELEEARQMADNGSKVEAMGVEEMNARAQRERDLCNRAIGHRKWAEDHVRRLKNQLKKKEDELSSCKTRLDYAENDDYAAGHIVNNFPFRKIGALPRLQTESRMDQVLSHVTYAGRYGRSYEPLELVGDGHLTVAVKTMMSRWNNIGAAEIDTIASLVTRNTTLAAMTRHWGLADRIKISPRANLTPEERIKVEGDVFEAWAAAYVEDFKLERGYQKIQEIFDPLCYWVRLEIRARRLFVLDPQA
ncbi:hypothetical protein Q8F55_004550 [Vanrija albida]|uniref:RNase III domain-containing protein n=1 Tax=Vanrija albida TaxID=181172 RepID=A0ABR3Q7P2_9TREE